jgi:hypothetical protein
VKRILYLATAALVALLILMPAALAQQDMVPGDDDPYSPEPNAVVVGSHEELEQIAGKPVPSQDPGEPPEGLPKTGGPSVSIILPAATLLLLGSGVFWAYVVLRRRLEEGGDVR